MKRINLRLSENLYERATRCASARGLSFEEAVCEGLTLLLDGIPPDQGSWVLPTFDGGGLLLPLEALKQFAYDDEALRSLPHADEEC